MRDSPVHKLLLAGLRQIVLGLCLTLLPGIAGARADENPPDKLAITALLRQGELAQLEAALVAYQERFEADPAAHWPVEVAFHAFANSDSALEKRLNEWVAAMPRSYAAKLARGVFYAHLGWLSRGVGNVANTPDRRFAEMRDFFALAESDLADALAKNPRLVTAYQRRANIAMATGRAADRERILQAGLAVHPRSVVLHEIYLFGLQPKWGGSLPAIRRYQAALKARFPDDTELAPLQGFADFVEGDVLVAAERYDDALQRFDRALGFGERAHAYLYARADATMQLERYDEAMAMVERALAVVPQDAETIVLRSKIELLQQRREDALQSAEAALALDRLNPRYLQWHAQVLYYNGRFADMVRDFDDALVYGSGDAWLQIERSRALLRFKQRTGDAVTAALSATRLAPQSAVAWLQYAEALWFTQDCGAKQALQLFHTLCRADGTCGAEKGRISPPMIPNMICRKA